MFNENHPLKIIEYRQIDNFLQRTIITGFFVQYRQLLRYVQHIEKRSQKSADQNRLLENNLC